MPSPLYIEWLNARNKDDRKFFGNAEFRREYTQLEMPGKAKMFKNLAHDDVKDTLRKISRQTGRSVINILSLCCGPGSDLLGILEAVNDASGVGWSAGQLLCDCTGLDAFDWNRDAFKSRLSSPDFCRKLGQIDCGFILEDMDSFVRGCLECKPSIEFDFICLSFADAGRHLKLIGTALPLLLSEYGRVLVLDNNISTVRSLANYGFRCTSTFADNKVCMQSRGRGSVVDPVSAQQSAYSLFLENNPDSRIPGFQENWLNEEGGRSWRSEQQSEGSVYEYDRCTRAQTGWCERNCSIL